MANKTLLIIVAILAFLLGGYLYKVVFGKDYISNTVVKTVYVPGDSVVVVKYIPVKGNPSASTSDTSKLTDSTSYLVETFPVDTFGTITVADTLQGKILDRKVSYDLQIPEKTITRVDTLKIESTTTLVPTPQYIVKLGAEAGGNGMMVDYSVKGALEFPNNVEVSARYSIPNQTGHIGVLIPIFKIKKKPARN